MKFVFRNDTIQHTIKFIVTDIIVSDTWMCLERGEGEKEIANHGRSRVKSFSQETVARGQQTPMIGENEPRLNSRNHAQDALGLPTQLPIFFSFNDGHGALEDLETPLGVCSSDSPRALGAGTSNGRSSSFVF